MRCWSVSSGDEMDETACAKLRSTLRLAARDLYRPTIMSSRLLRTARDVRKRLTLAGGCAILLAAASGCATTGATFNSGVGDSFPLRPPYYAGKTIAAGTRIGYFPITFQRGATEAETLDLSSGPGSAVAPLVAEMNRYLDSLRIGTPLAVNIVVTGTPPDVQFGCNRTASRFECDARDDQSANARGDRGNLRDMRLAVGRPSDDWTTWAAKEMANGGVPNALVITVEVSDYFIRQHGLVGRKAVELGTNYTIDVPWLTGVDTPVNVLQLTGAVVDTSGTALRIGAEGMLARRTGMMVGALAAQRVITEEDVEQLRTARRSNLPGQPLVWQVALRNLVAQLTGRPELAMR